MNKLLTDYIIKKQRYSEKTYTWYKYIKPDVNMNISEYRNKQNAENYKNSRINFNI
jgi:hypothetical protein